MGVADLSSSPLDDPNFDIADETEIDSEIELESAQSLEIVGRRIAHRNVQTDDVDAFADSTDWPIGALCFLRNYGAATARIWRSASKVSLPTPRRPTRKWRRFCAPSSTSKPTSTP